MKQITCSECGASIDYRSTSGLCITHFRATYKVPDDFLAMSTKGNRSGRKLAAHYGVSRETIARWKSEQAIVTGARTCWSADEDAYLRANYATASRTDIAAHLGRSEPAVKGRSALLGLTSGKPRGWNLTTRRELMSKMSAGHSGEAAYLQAYGPIYRCHSDGQQAQIGAYWFWAGQVLTHDEMEAKARAHRERRELLAA